MYLRFTPGGRWEAFAVLPYDEICECLTSDARGNVYVKKYNHDQIIKVDASGSAMPTLTTAVREPDAVVCGSPSTSEKD